MKLRKSFLQILNVDKMFMPRLRPHFSLPQLPNLSQSTTNLTQTINLTKQIANMLRRKPTAITLTTEDVAIYEDARTREALQREQLAQAQAQAQARNQNQNQNLRDPGDELRPLPGDRAKQQQQVKSREERLGLGLGGGSSRG